MPNGKTHTLTGMLAGVATSFILQEKTRPGQPADLGHLIFCGVTGAATGRFPDILEPALHPNHREFCHSFVFGLAVGYVGVQVWKELTQESLFLEKVKEADPWVQLILLLLLVAIAAYLIHLALDAFTPKGLPFA